MFRRRARGRGFHVGQEKCAVGRGTSIMKTFSDGSHLPGMLTGQIVMETGLLIFTGLMGPAVVRPGGST